MQALYTLVCYFKWARLQPGKCYHSYFVDKETTEAPKVCHLRGHTQSESRGVSWDLKAGLHYARHSLCYWQRPDLTHATFLRIHFMELKTKLGNVLSVFVRMCPGALLSLCAPTGDDTWACRGLTGSRLSSHSYSFSHLFTLSWLSVVVWGYFRPLFFSHKCI